MSSGLSADDGDRVVIASGWDGAGRLGVLAGPQFFFEQWWCPVKWDDDHDPEVYKSAGLELAEAVAS